MSNIDGCQEGVLPIISESDLVICRKTIRQLTTTAGFGITDVTRIVTAVSELARNIHIHAGAGTMRWHIIRLNNKIEIELIFEDSGPGIANIAQALQPGYSTVNSMGMGLPGVQRLMDDLHITSELGTGSIVTTKKWARVR